jgi:hypothetical protein
MVTGEMRRYLEEAKQEYCDLNTGEVNWPGWCRSGRDEDSALNALFEYGLRFAGAIPNCYPIGLIN